MIFLLLYPSLPLYEFNTLLQDLMATGENGRWLVPVQRLADRTENICARAVAMTQRPLVVEDIVLEKIGRA